VRFRVAFLQCVIMYGKNTFGCLGVDPAAAESPTAARSGGRIGTLG
jgi:hypothetical protein